MNIPIVYEDEFIMVLNKPSGLLTIPTPRNETRTLTSILNDDAKERGQAYRLHPAHRLDRETSGLIVYAKGKSIQKKMMALFHDKKVKKTYIAFVQGILKQKQGVIDTPIERLSAVTNYRVIEERAYFSVVEVMPKTGRKNQIRIHFKYIGHPVVGDTKFAFRKDYKLKAKRLMLHANTLEFTHPINNKALRLDSGPEQDFEDFLKKHKD
ncbi:MAG: RluA family pseudouridine synthase [Candidatus Omnitrophica bacterium]|nr:RluA family pseudouridine synthase [Candidatus Omnitrophota bacterium]